MSTRKRLIRPFSLSVSVGGTPVQHARAGPADAKRDAASTISSATLENVGRARTSRTARHSWSHVGLTRSRRGWSPAVSLLPISRLHRSSRIRENEPAQVRMIHPVDWKFLTFWCFAMWALSLVMGWRASRRTRADLASAKRVVAHLERERDAAVAECGRLTERHRHWVMHATALGVPDSTPVERTVLIIASESDRRLVH